MLHGQETDRPLTSPVPVELSRPNRPGRALGARAELWTHRGGNRQRCWGERDKSSRSSRRGGNPSCRSARRGVRSSARSATQQNNGRDLWAKSTSFLGRACFHLTARCEGNYYLFAACIFMSVLPGASNARLFSFLNRSTAKTKGERNPSFERFPFASKNLPQLLPGSILHQRVSPPC